MVEGDDLIKQVFAWDEGSASFTTDPVAPFDRMCSADRPVPTALLNAFSGNGTSEILFMNGEETSDGRAFAHVVTGPDAGSSYRLAHLGFAPFENVVLDPTEQDTSVTVMMEDAENGEIFVYVGQKQASGNEVEKAGLVGGNLYSLAVVGKPYELDEVIANAIGPAETFTLKLIGTPGDRPTNATEMKARGADTVTPVDPTQTFESLEFGGPEDGVWDKRPGHGNTFYFATKGTASNGITAPTRLWRLELADIVDPAAGGTMTLLLDGPENRLGSLDNMTSEVLAGQPKLYLQEDLGGDARLSKIWEYDVSTGQLEEIAAHDPARFFDGGAELERGRLSPRRELEPDHRRHPHRSGAHPARLRRGPGSAGERSRAAADAPRRGVLLPPRVRPGRPERGHPARPAPGIRRSRRPASPPEPSPRRPSSCRGTVSRTRSSSASSARPTATRPGR